MDELSALVSSAKMNKKQLLEALSVSLGTCVSCHATYRISLATEQEKMIRTLRGLMQAGP